MKTWDVVIVGGGVIGLSIALELHKRGRHALVIDRHEPGTEASYAAAGILEHCDPHLPKPLKQLAKASAKLYPEFVHELHDETKVPIDYRAQGTIYFPDPTDKLDSGDPLSFSALQALEPHLVPPGDGFYLPEASIDPRHLVKALRLSLIHRGVDFVTGSAVLAIDVEDRRVHGVRTEKSRYPSAVVINCAGAWACKIDPMPLRTRPVKGQMLSIVPKPGAPHFPVQHVVRGGGCYLVPRSDGKVVIGSTLEDAGFDKRVDPAVIQDLHQRAACLLPELGEGRILEAWAGLRPGTPDNLPMIGETSFLGYLVATGHYRDGILLAPITGKLIGQIVEGSTLEFDLLPFAPERFH